MTELFDRSVGMGFQHSFAAASGLSGSSPEVSGHLPAFAEPLPGQIALWPSSESGSLPRNTPIGITHPKTDISHQYRLAALDGFQSAQGDCPHSTWIPGSCTNHGSVRWSLKPCKRRTCPVCGPRRRREHAERIAWGVRSGMMIEDKQYAWLVLTFSEPWAVEPQFKSEAVRRMGAFIKWLRQQGMPDMQYVSTFELTTADKRLHINLVCGDWKWIPHWKLRARWGARVSVEYVKDEAGDIGAELTANYSPEGLGGYLSKLEQMVPEEWGRHVSFSQGWPSTPTTHKPERVGEVEWTFPTVDRLQGLSLAFEQGLMVVTSEGEYGFQSQIDRIPECHCWEWRSARAARLARLVPEDPVWDYATYESIRESVR